MHPRLWGSTGNLNSPSKKGRFPQSGVPLLRTTISRPRRATTSSRAVAGFARLRAVAAILPISCDPGYVLAIPCVSRCTESRRQPIYLDTGMCVRTGFLKSRGDDNASAARQFHLAFLVYSRVPVRAERRRAARLGKAGTRQRYLRNTLSPDPQQGRRADRRRPASRTTEHGRSGISFLSARDAASRLS